MKKIEILRSRNLFKRIALFGKRHETPLLRCRYLIHDDPGLSLLVAFKVPARHFNAVRRNRIRRLMQEAFTKERAGLDRMLVQSARKVAMVFTFRHGVDVGRLRLSSVQSCIGEACAAVASRLGRGS